MLVLFRAVYRHPVWRVAFLAACGAALALGLGLVATHALAARNSAPPAQSALPAPQSTATPPFGPIITLPPDVTLPTPTPRAAATALPTATPPPAASATPFAPATPLPTLRSELMGVQINPDVSLEDFDFMLWLAKRLGVKWIKLQFAWDILEPQRGVFSERFYAYRMFVQRANQQGFKVMISIVSAPDWARASLEEEGPPRDPNDLANFITRLMGEVRTDLYGNSYFDAIEVWNEPNLRREWNGAPIHGAEYMRLFDAAYRAIRAAEGGHSVTIITAGLAPTGINDGVTAVDDREFLRQMYAAGLANPAYENVAIGTHPYGAANPPDARWCGQADCGPPGYNNHPSWFFLDTIEDYHQIMLENGDTSRQLWATEFGWGTYEGFTLEDGRPAPPPADPPYLSWIDQETQANYILRAFEIAQTLPYMGPMILWSLNYYNPILVAQSDPRPAYSLLRGGADPLRPAFKLLEAAPKQ